MGSKKLFLNSGFSFICSLLLVGAGLITKIALTHLLSATEFGILVACQTFFSILVFAAGLGLSDALVKFIGSEGSCDLSQKKIILSTVLRITLISSLLLCLLYFLITFVMVDGLKSKAELITILNFFILFLPIKLASDMIGSAYQGAGQLYIKLLVADIFPAVLFILGLGILYQLGINTFGWIIFIYLIPFAISMLVYSGIFKISDIFNSSPTNALKNELLRFSLPLFFAGIVSWPQALLPFIIGLVLPIELVSYYSLSISLASFIYLSSTAVEAAGLSVWAGYFSGNNLNAIIHDYRLTTRFGIILGSIIAFVLIVYPSEVVNILFGSQFQKIADILPLFSGIFFINLLTGPTESILKVYAETRFIFKVRLISSAVVLIIIYPFLKIWGLYGAILTFGLSIMIGGVGMYSMRIYRVCGIHPFDAKYFKTILCILASGFSTFFLMRTLPKSSMDAFLLLQGVIFYTAFLLITSLKSGAVTDSETNVIKHFVKKIFGGISS